LRKKLGPKVVDKLVYSQLYGSYVKTNFQQVGGKVLPAPMSNAVYDFDEVVNFEGDRRGEGGRSDESEDDAGDDSDDDDEDTTWYVCCEFNRRADYI
jgi:hypothetical protein